MTDDKRWEIYFRHHAPTERIPDNYWKLMEDIEHETLREMEDRKEIKRCTAMDGYLVLLK